jgi:molybdopterin converting factor small subunit
MGDQALKVKVSIVGVLERILLGGEDVVEAESLTVQGLLEALAERHGEPFARVVVDANGLREGLCLLVNGRNVLSFPDTYQTNLKNGDEVVITVQVTGGKGRGRD